MVVLSFTKEPVPNVRINSRAEWSGHPYSISFASFLNSSRERSGSSSGSFFDAGSLVGFPGCFKPIARFIHKTEL
jgi:hypothetical protein